MDSLCTHLLTDTEHNFSTAVQQVGLPLPAAAILSLKVQVEFDGSEWLLYGAENCELGRADHLVVSSMAIACSLRWQRLFGTKAPLVELATRAGDGALSQCTATLDANGDSARPVFTLLMAFERTDDQHYWLDNLPFDLNVVKGHPEIAKIVRNQCATAAYDTITIHSTHEFAQQAADVFGSKSSVALLQQPSNDKKVREMELSERLMAGWLELAGERCGKNAAKPDWGPHLHRWGGAFSTTVLDEPASIPSMNLSVCGDFVGHNAGSVESAAVSGLAAARAALALHGC